MIALAAMLASAATPWIVCRALRGWFAVERSGPERMRARALVRYRRANLIASAVAIPLAAVVGALTVDEALTARFPTAGSWFFATLCATTAWASAAVSQRTREQAERMSTLETIGRVTWLAAVPSAGVGLALLAGTTIESAVPVVPTARAILASAAAVVAVLVVSPWLAIQLGLWRALPTRIEVDGELRWRVVHVPAPCPFLTHAAALPWLRVVLVTDGLLSRVPESRWRALVRYEIGDVDRSPKDRKARWAVAVPLSLIVFIAASAVGKGDPGKLVAATCIAAVFTLAAAWIANRETQTTVSSPRHGPSMGELAQALRSLPPLQGQALPRTSHRPLGPGVYDRLFALGHDPGRRPHP